MSEEFVVKRLPVSVDLGKVTGYLRERGLPHRIYEQGDEQVLVVYDERLVASIAQFVDGVLAGQFQIQEEIQVHHNDTTKNASSLIDQLIAFPITLMMILLSFAGAALTALDTQDRWIGLFSFQAIGTSQFLPLSYGLEAGEWWRLITPAFLHFGIMHVVFNCLWIWDFGRRLEQLLGSLLFLLLVITTAVASNVIQYLWMPNTLFGGMSGVVYALIGFIAVFHKLNPHPETAVRPGIIGFMLFWLVFCMTGATDVFLDSGVANGAHLGGLVAGAILGGVVAKLLTGKRH